MQRIIQVLIFFLFFLLGGCGVYSFTGASIEGKTINIHVFENRARNIRPTLTPTLTDKIRSRILSQTGLTATTEEEVDYDLQGTITGYETSVSGITGTQTASQNRLTISVEVTFANKLNKKANFKQTFSRFADFPATQNLNDVETQLINDIGTQLADDIFNKAFVNW